MEVRRHTGAQADFRSGVRVYSPEKNGSLSNHSAPEVASWGAKVHCNAVGFLLATEGGEMKSNRILRLPEVIRVSGLARSTIYLRVQEKRFPAPIKLSERSVGWVETEVQSWIDQRIQESRGEGSAK